MPDTHRLDGLAWFAEPWSRTQPHKFQSVFALAPLKLRRTRFALAVTRGRATRSPSCADYGRTTRL